MSALVENGQRAKLDDRWLPLRGESSNREEEGRYMYIYMQKRERERERSLGSYSDELYVEATKRLMRSRKRQ